VPTYLDIAGLSVRYGPTEVLRDISLAVDAGGFVALLGSSGCGKTTLLRAIAGFIAPAHGSISLDGRDITALAPEKRNTAMVFQSYALWPHMTVYQNMAYGLRLRRRSQGEIAAKIDGLLTLLHLDGLGGRNVTQLSGGQRQRVALGRALAIDPAVLLLDEPLSNLDARIRVELRSEIRAVQSRLGITAIHVTHDREEAMVLADRIVVLNGGRIEQAGTPEDVYHRPASPFVASFMGADNIIRLRVRRTGDRDIEATLASGMALGPARLPAGEGGVHLAAKLNGSDTAADVRAEAVRLSPAGVSPSENCLMLPGTVDQVSYPGGVWRYAVKADAHRFVIDDEHKYAQGDTVGIVLPAAALHLFPSLPGPSNLSKEQLQ
jgi:ABC-type Fe3+/spermidine/putrescine transport system ATPase subunit